MGEGQFMPPGALGVLTHNISVHPEYLHSCKVWKSNAHHLKLASLREMINSLFQAPLLEKGPEASQERKLACGWLSPCLTAPANVPPGDPPALWTGYRGPKLLWLLDPATLALQACGDGADFF